MDHAAILGSLTTPPYEIIGRSVEGRPLLARRFPGTAPAVVLFGAIHGDEPLGVHCLLQLAAELGALRLPPPPRDTWILPIANPDGFVAGRKSNARDVDLNRNFPATNWRRAHEPGYDPGAFPASEPETRGLIDLIDRTQARRLIALHSPHRTVNWDGAGEALAQRMGALNGYGASAEIGYPTPGSFGSLYGIDCQCEVITLEIPPIEEHIAWQQNRAALYATLDP
jgi:protein MpaA